METSFELNKPNYFTPKLVAEIEEFDPDQYNNKWYNVLFDGDAETFMWLAKNPPEEGKKYWGHIEKTKSGKRLRFKSDKLPEGIALAPASKPSAPVHEDNKYLKDVSDVPRSLVIELLKYYDVQSLWNSPKYEQMINLAQSLNDDIVSMITGNRSGSQSGGGLQLTDSPKATNELKSPAAAVPIKEKLAQADWTEGLEEPEDA